MSTTPIPNVSQKLRTIDADYQRATKWPRRRAILAAALGFGIVLLTALGHWWPWGAGLATLLFLLTGYEVLANLPRIEQAFRQRRMVAYAESRAQLACRA